MKSKPHTVYHKDGSVWAVGHLRDGATNGYWEWFRKDGTKSRSGHFENGQHQSFRRHHRQTPIFTLMQRKQWMSANEWDPSFKSEISNYFHAAAPAKKSFGETFGAATD